MREVPESNKFSLMAELGRSCWLLTFPSTKIGHQPTSHCPSWETKAYSWHIRAAAINKQDLVVRKDR